MTRLQQTYNDCFKHNIYTFKPTTKEGKHEPKQTKPNQTKPNQTKPNQTKCDDDRVE
jgi:hypothetical protein